MGTGGEHMGVMVEVWPISADERGLWLLSPEAWQAGRVPADDEPHSEVVGLLYDHGVQDTAAFVHSTSWRVDGPHVVLTYVAVVDRGDAPDVRDRWAAAQPISARVLDAVGNSAAGPALDPPTPRYLDVLMHAVRHLRFLLDHDAEAAAVLERLGWTRHLNALTPALAGMYQDGATNGMPTVR